MILSTKTTLKYTNTTKLEKLNLFLEEYKRVMSLFIDMLWEEKSIYKTLDKQYTSQINSWLSARAIQAAGKQASGIIRGTKRKNEKREFIYNKLVEKGTFKKARKLKKIIDNAKTTKPNIKTIEAELDSRFVKINFNNKTSFDGWITLTSLGNKLKIELPFKKTRHFNKLAAQGKLKNGIRISNNTITFNFAIDKKEVKTQGAVIGLDIGVKNVFTLSNGIASQPDIHGHTLDTINSKLSRKKKGSKAFEAAQAHRTNYINASINIINFSEIKTLKIENIKNLRKGTKSSRKLSHFTYVEVFIKLNRAAALNGCSVIKVSPTYTSQRCSSCGWVCKRNRKGKQFICVICKFSQDADINAAVNISLDLPEISKEEWQLHKNKKGFYWNEVGRARIVPSTGKE